MFSDSSYDYWFFGGGGNKRTALCPWCNKGTTVFRYFGGCVTRELLSLEMRVKCYINVA